MGDLNGNDPIKDTFIDELESSVRKLIRSNKTSKADKLSAINAGIKIAAIKHKINGGDDDKGFFGK